MRTWSSTTAIRSAPTLSFRRRSLMGAFISIASATLPVAPPSKRKRKLCSKRKRRPPPRRKPKKRKPKRRNQKRKSQRRNQSLRKCSALQGVPGEEYCILWILVGELFDCTVLHNQFGCRAGKAGNLCNHPRKNLHRVRRRNRRRHFDHSRRENRHSGRGGGTSRRRTNHRRKRAASLPCPLHPHHANGIERDQCSQLDRRFL